MPRGAAPVLDRIGAVPSIRCADAEAGVDGYLSGALVPQTLDASISINYYRHSPYIENIVPGWPDPNDAKEGSTRLQLRVRPTDTIDAITQDRPYRRGRSFDEAREELIRHRGSQFDPEAVDAFLEALPNFAELPESLVRLVGFETRPGTPGNVEESGDPGQSG